MDKSTKRWALGAMIAALAGYLAGILTAPKSGKETRRDIKDAAERSRLEAEKQLKKLHTQMSQALAEAREKVTTAQGTAKKDLQKAIDKTAVAKEKARELLSAFHDGSAEDKELQKAVDEATKAIGHLRAYLKK